MSLTESEVVARPVERYARAWRVKDGFEVSIGVEYRDDGEVDSLTTTLREWADKALQLGEHTVAVSYIETKCRAHWPDRAFFIETEREGRGVQVFQPFGIPKRDP